MPRTKQVSFAIESERVDTVAKIVTRAVAMAAESGRKLERLDITMDIIACHANGCPLKLEALLEADDFNFAHDVFGINRHIDRTTGTLQDCFLPRFHNANAGKIPA